MIDYNAILGKIKTKFDKEVVSNEVYLDMEIGNVITGRFLPFIKNLDKSVFNYFWHSYMSLAQNDEKFKKRIFRFCPNTNKKYCPVCDASVKMWKTADLKIKELSKPIRRHSNTIVNFYVLDDQKHPENNGKVKVFKYGTQIQKIINEATEGMDKEIFGSRIWRLDEQGCSFRLKIDKKAAKDDDGKEKEFATYELSKFLPASKIDDMTNEKIEQILNGCFDLEKLIDIVAVEVLEKEIKEHYLDKINVAKDSVPTTTNTKEQNKPTPSVADTVVTSKETTKTPTNNTELKIEDIKETQLDDLLKQLETNEIPF